jgi:hypothetical protein
MIRQVPWSETPDTSVGPRPRHAGGPGARERHRIDDARLSAARVVERVQDTLLPDRLGRVGVASG